MFKGVGVRFVDFSQYFSFTETKLFHFHWILKKQGGGGGARRGFERTEIPPLGPPLKLSICSLFNIS